MPRFLALGSVQHRTSQVQIVANDFFEELTPSQGAVEDLRQAHFHLPDREGYTVHATGDLPSATEVVKNCTPDLLLTNLYIPGTTGHDAAQFLRSMCPNMRVLVVAGLPDDRLIKDRTKGEGFAAFPKPFTPKQLTEKVKNVLQGKLE